MAHFIFYDLPPEVKEEVSRLRWQMAGNRMLLACYRLQTLLAKANFNPNQPRVPAGFREGGRWTDGTDNRTPRGNKPKDRVRVAENIKPGVRSDIAVSNSKTSGRWQPTNADGTVYRGASPRIVPPSIDADEKIAEAAKHKLDFLWFYKQVRNGGPWDYKQTDPKYADFGNFLYGATGKAAGFSEATLLRAAGWAQVEAGTSRKEWGVPVTLPQAVLGVGGKPPFGDDPEDQRWISHGFKYYDARNRKPPK